MKPMTVLTTVFQVIVTAAALKAALTTLSRPMSGQPMQPNSFRNRRLGNISVEGYDEDELGLDYEDLL